MKNKLLTLILMSSLMMSSCGNKVESLNNGTNIEMKDDIFNEDESRYITFEDIINEYGDYTYFDEVLDSKKSKEQLFELDKKMIEYIETQNIDTYYMSMNGYNVISQLRDDLLASSVAKREYIDKDYSETKDKIEYKYGTIFSETKHKYYVPSNLKNKYFVLCEKVELLKINTYTEEEYYKELNSILTLAKEILLTGEGMRNEDNLIISSGVNLDLNTCTKDEYAEVVSRILVK